MKKIFTSALICAAGVALSAQCLAMPAITPTVDQVIADQVLRLRQLCKSTGGVAETRQTRGATGFTAMCSTKDYGAFSVVVRVDAKPGNYSLSASFDERWADTFVPEGEAFMAAVAGVPGVKASLTGTNLEMGQSYFSCRLTR